MNYDADIGMKLTDFIQIGMIDCAIITEPLVECIPFEAICAQQSIRLIFFCLNYERRYEYLHLQ